MLALTGEGRILRCALGQCSRTRALYPSGRAAVDSNDGKRKSYRRPSTPQETARRKAWGKEWGKINSEHAKQLRAEGK